MADKTAPERIWLQTGGNFAEAMRGEVTWSQDRINDDDEEYVRADPHLGGSFYKEADIDRLMDRAEKAEAEIERLRGFVFEIMSGWPEGCDADTFTLQDAAVKYGLLREVPGGYDPAKHYDPFDICEPGDRWYEWAIPKPSGLDFLDIRWPCLC